MVPRSTIWLLVAIQVVFVSAQYVAFENRHISGGRLQRDSPTLLTCRMKCKRTEWCAALDFDFTARSCWFHTLTHACSPTGFMINTRHVKFIGCHENSHGLGGARQAGVRDAVTCVSSCQDDCVAVDFDESDNSCWFHTETTACNALRSKSRCTHYKKKQCEVHESPTATTPIPDSSDDTNASSEEEVPFEGAPANVLAKIGDRIENRHVIGGSLKSAYRDWVSCVKACVGSCRAVDFDRRDQSCWHHLGPAACAAPVSFRASCTHYKMNTCSTALTFNDPGILAPAIRSPMVPAQRAISAGSGQCGMPMFSPRGGRIVGGDEARPHSWPWQVALRNRNARSSRCAGTFIAPSWILTTAHCVDQDLVPANWLVLSGAHDLLSIENGRIAHTVQSIVIHERFDLNTFDNDIALIKLTTPAAWSGVRSPVCLPPPGFQFAGGTQCLITGWGVAANGRRPLKQAPIPTVAEATCKRPDWLGSEFTLTPRMMCAGYQHGGVDTCQGDSGGPLVCFMGQKWVQAGLTSFGRGCGLPQKPGVYTKVSHFNAWIQGVMNSF